MVPPEDPSPFDSAATLLVRRALPDLVVPVQRLLWPELGPDEVAGLIAARHVLVLADVASAPKADPLGAVAFDAGAGGRVARMRAVAVVRPLRRHGFGRRLVEGAMTWLRAEGFEVLEALATSGTPAAFLTAVGFERAPGDPDHLFTYRL